MGQQFIQPSTLGYLAQGVDVLTPTGTGAAFDMVANFSNPTIEEFYAAPTSAFPVVRTGGPAFGAAFSINVEGVWVVKARVQVAALDPEAGASTVLGAIGLDNLPGEFNTDPANESARILVNGLVQVPPLQQLPLLLTTPPFVVTRAMALSTTLGLVRLLLSDNAGGPPDPVSIVPALCSIRFARLGGLPGV